uniref:Uncharacterized protein n=1 Tax=Picea glauca TaxID=3330 RepID=A0A101M3P3_PICGL|nr:hypothetical protein ABT39_MTgene185 [Picea glauca]QHR89322.1 hypothetical protein Q903MT_gene3343 [Picea sitchensis]
MMDSTLLCSYPNDEQFCYLFPKPTKLTGVDKKLASWNEPNSTGLIPELNDEFHSLINRTKLA